MRVLYPAFPLTALPAFVRQLKNLRVIPAPMPPAFKWKIRYALFIITAGTIVLTPILLGQQPTVSPGNIPVGWYVYPETKLKKSG